MKNRKSGGCGFSPGNGVNGTLLRVAALAIFSFVIFVEGVSAQGAIGVYPSRPVAMVVSAAPGGPNEREARLYANKLGEFMGQPFLLEFKPGAGTTMGPAYVAKSAPDGYTLLVATGNFTVAPNFYEDLPYDNVRDSAPIALMSQRTSALLVHPSFPARTFTEYIAYAKANPERINFATTGVGSITHLAGAWMHGSTDTKVTFVHYKGAGPQLVDLVAGRVNATAIGLLSGLPQIKSGKLRALAILNLKRSTLLPELPTIAEQGIPGFDYPAWLGVVAPGATSLAIVNKLNDGLVRVAKSPDVAAQLETEGGAMIGSTPAQFRQLISTETIRWRKLVQDLGIKLEE